MKELNYLKFYIGCTATGQDSRNPHFKPVTGMLTSVGIYGSIDFGNATIHDVNKNECSEFSDFEVKPHLRPISSLTDSDLIELFKLFFDYEIDPSNYAIAYVKHRITTTRFTPTQFALLCSWGVDLFNLIKTDKAIEI